MENTKVAMIAKRVEGFAIGFIGIYFFSTGTSYFQERLIYRMPRILVPVYELLGGVGLAVAMLMLGVGLLVWGFSMWKSTAGKSLLYWIIAVAGLAAGVFLANYNFKSSENRMQEIEDARQKQIEEVDRSERPNFKNTEIDQFFDEFDTLYTRLETNATVTDSVQKIDEEYQQWLTKTADLLSPLSNDQKYEFSKYSAKLSIRWHDKMQEIGTD